MPQAHTALNDGRWERSKWEGVELSEKTLGIIGLGRIGKLVAQRACAFGMRLMAYDPFVAAERARQLTVDLVDLDTLVAQTDFITIHVAKTPQTVGLINADYLAKAKPGLRIINVARGGIVDEAALADAIRDGRIAGAALDVFAKEPTTESPLFDLPRWWSPRTSAPAPPRRRTRRATRSPSRWSWPSPATSCRSPST